MNRLIWASLAALGVAVVPEAGAAIMTPEYSAVSNAEAGGIPFSFVDISGTGTAIISGDDFGAVQALAAAFPFYGTSQGSVFANTNGYLIFTGSPGLNDNVNVALPTGKFSPPAIAVYWDDLVSTIHYQHFAGGAGPFAGATSIFQWTGGYCDPSLSGCSTDPTALLQVLLSHADGRILIQYSDTACPTCPSPHSNGASATVGIQSTNAGPSLQWSFDTAASIPNSSTILFTPTPEPSSLVLIGAGLLAVGGIRRRRSRLS